MNFVGKILVDDDYFEEYLQIHHPGKNLEDFKLEEIENWPINDIFPCLEVIIPEMLREMLSNDFDSFSHLPYHQLEYYNYEGIMLWSCSHCGWWCDLFDQRLMEEHLIKRCLKVN